MSLPMCVMIPFPQRPHICREAAEGLDPRGREARPRTQIALNANYWFWGTRGARGASSLSKMPPRPGSAGLAGPPAAGAVPLPGVVVTGVVPNTEPWRAE